MHACTPHIEQTCLYIRHACQVCFLNCWAEERKNMDAKAAMNINRSKVGFSRNALGRLLNSQIRKLEQPGWRNRLTGAVQSFPELASELGVPQVNIAGGAYYRGAAIKHGAPVFIGSGTSSMISVVACIDVQGQLGAFLRRCQLRGSAYMSSTWSVLPEVECLMFGETPMRVPKCWRREGYDGLQVLH